MEELVFNVMDQVADIGVATTYVLDEDDVAVGAGKTATVTITTPSAGVSYSVSTRTFSFTKEALAATGPLVVSGTFADGTGANANSISFSFVVLVQDPLTKDPTVAALVIAKDTVVRALVPLYLKSEDLTTEEKATVLELERKMEGLDRVMDHLHRRYAILV